MPPDDQGHDQKGQTNHTPVMLSLVPQPIDNERTQGKTDSESNGCHRDVAGGIEDDDPDGQAHHEADRHHSEKPPHCGRHSLAPPETGKERVGVAKNGGRQAPQAQNGIARGIKEGNHEPVGGEEALNEIQGKDGITGRFAYFPQNVGCSWVAATHGVNVDSESLGHDNRERNRTKQVANQGNANCLYG